MDSSLYQSRIWIEGSICALEGYLQPDTHNVVCLFLHLRHTFLHTVVIRSYTDNHWSYDDRVTHRYEEFYSGIAIRRYQVFGPSWWFYGEFFIDTFKHREVTQSLINHPLLSCMSCWGVTLMCNSLPLLAITIFFQLSNIWFVSFIRVSKDFKETDSCSDMTPRDSFTFNSLESSPTASPLRNRTKSVTETVLHAIHDLELLAKPHITSLVQSTKRGVTQLANAARLGDTLSREDLPLHLYSLKLIKDSGDDDGSPPTYQLGEVIIIEFTAVRETMKRKDWYNTCKLGLVCTA
jgi:Phospholipid methyltransferase